MLMEWAVFVLLIGNADVKLAFLPVHANLNPLVSAKQRKTQLHLPDSK